jgi:hypothetical protein
LETKFNLLRIDHMASFWEHEIPLLFLGTARNFSDHMSQFQLSRKTLYHEII